MKKIQNFAAYFFIISVAILSVISVMGVWDIFGTDVIWKSFKTLGLLAVVAIIAMAAGNHIENGDTTNTVVETPDPAWSQIRKSTIVILIVSISLLALLGVLSIWDIIKDADIQYKSLSSLAILAFGALVIILTCKDRESVGKKKTTKPVSTTFTVTKDTPTLS